MNGTIKRLVSDKGFGFIAAQDGSEYFFHQSACIGTRFDELREGQAVTFVRPDQWIDQWATYAPDDAWRTLLRRFPELRLAVPVEDLRWAHGDGLVLRGLSELPVIAGPAS